MIEIVQAGARSGSVDIPASKSAAHRQLICAALSEKESDLICDGMSKDIAATIRCLEGLGAKVSQTNENTLHIVPVKRGAAADTERAHLYCGESGSTLRFMLPVAAALGRSVVFHMEGKLPSRPHDALVKAMTEHEAVIRQKDDLLYCDGQLTPGEYTIPGDISSQFISGLLFALPMVPGDSHLVIEGKIESSAYIVMTEQAILKAKIRFEKGDHEYHIPGGQVYDAPERNRVEKDWSNAAFFLCMGAMSEEGIVVDGLDQESTQGDKKILEILKRFGAEVSVEGDRVTVKKGTLTGQTVDAAEIPDLVPVVSILAAGAEGVTHIVNAERLRYKESDRLATTAALIQAIGGEVKELPDGLVITGKKLTGGNVNSENDHRIAMSAATAAMYCTEEIVVNGAECVEKSYPAFWKHLGSLKK